MNIQEQLAGPTDSIANEVGNYSFVNLYEPDPVQFSFDTIGWPILGILFLITLLVGTYFWWKHFQKNQYRRKALKTLETLTLPDQHLEIFVVLKSTAIHAFGREKVGGLVGKDWLEFLEKSGKNVHLLPQEKQILSLIYKNEPLPREVQHQILSNVIKWIRTHAS